MHVSILDVPFIFRDFILLFCQCSLNELKTISNAYERAGAGGKKNSLSA